MIQSQEVHGYPTCCKLQLPTCAYSTHMHNIMANNHLCPSTTCEILWAYSFSVETGAPTTTCWIDVCGCLSSFGPCCRIDVFGPQTFELGDIHLRDHNKESGMANSFPFRPQFQDGVFGVSCTELSYFPAICHIGNLECLQTCFFPSTLERSNEKI